MKHTRLFVTVLAGRDVCRRLCASALLLVVMCASCRSAARLNTDPAKRENGANSKVDVVRLIGSAEAAWFQNHGRYATLAELIQSGQVERTAGQSSDYRSAVKWLSLQSESQPVAGFSLNLTVSSSRTGYQLYLTQKGKECGVGWFTDEAGILYEGKAVNCEEHSPASASKNWIPPDIHAVLPPVRNDGPCPLQEILHEASVRATELVENLQRFTATEQIEHTEFSRNGEPHKSNSELFTYTAEIKQNANGGFWIEEYRSSKIPTDTPPLADTGTATFALIFHPMLVGNFKVQCEGLTDLQGTRAWQLRFEEGSDLSHTFSSILIKDTEYRLRVKGRAWIAADNYEVLRVQTDLVAPIPEIYLEVEHCDISYAPVEFAKNKARLWLPESASMQISYRGRRYRRLHSFSHFQLFLVETEQKVKEPTPGPSGAP